MSKLVKGKMNKVFSALLIAIGIFLSMKTRVDDIEGRLEELE